MNVIKYIKNYVSRIYNYCKTLNYIRNIKDEENNFALLRIKDFLCDLFFTIFSVNFGGNEISIQDIFSLLQIISDVGKSWNSIKELWNQSNIKEGWIKKINKILIFMTERINEINTFVNLDKKFYGNFIDYLNFYIDAYIENDIENDNNKMIVDKEEKKDNKEINFNEIISILYLLKDIKFIKEENDTYNLLLKILKIISEYNLDNQLKAFEIISNFQYQENLSNELILNINKVYINGLIEKNEYENAEKNIKKILQLIEPNSKEEIEIFILNFIIFFQKNESEEKLQNILEIIFEHKDLTIDLIEKIIIKISKNSEPILFLKIFIKKINEMKNFKFGNSKIIFNFEILKNFPKFTLVFLYIFFKDIINIKKKLLNEINNPNFLDFLKNLSESFLENIFYENYDNLLYLIPTILHNIICFFLTIDNLNENFGSYFLIEIINRGKKIKKYDFWKKFSDLSIEIYIEKKEFIKLKNLLNEIDPENNKNIIQPNSLFYYAKIILILGEGIKWTTLNNIQKLLISLNNSENFDLIYYFKIINFIYINNFQEINLFSIILLSFIKKFIEINNNNENNNNNEQKIINENYKNYSLMDCCYEVLYYTSKMQNFVKSIENFSEIFNILGNLLENKIFDKNNKKDSFITRKISTIINIIKLLIDLTKNKDIKENFPESIIIDLFKMINCVFLNFDFFLKNEISEFSNEMIKQILTLFEIYKNLNLFYITYDYNCLIENKNNLNEKSNNKQDFIKLKNKFILYENNYNNTIKLLQNFLIEKKNEELLKIFNEKINIINSNITNSLTENILKLEIFVRTEEQENIDEYISNVLEDSYNNKNLIFMINSILFQNGLKNLQFKFLGNLLDKIISTKANELFNKIYLVEDVLNIFKDYISSIDENDVPTKIKILKQYESFIVKLYLKIDIQLLCENINWIYFKIFKFFEGNENIDKNSQDFLILKNIFDELNILKIENKPYLTETLSSLILNKLI